MITAALHENMYVAYSAQTCQLYKAWKGGVIFDGAVYTTHHGPQPSSKGYAYYVQPEQHDFWYLVKEGKEIRVSPRFKGYSLKGNKVTFYFQIADVAGNIGPEVTFGASCLKSNKKPLARHRHGLPAHNADTVRAARLVG
jgi:cytochrome c